MAKRQVGNGTFGVWTAEREQNVLKDKETLQCTL
jgi:hypothetical protein